MQILRDDETIKKGDIIFSDEREVLLGIQTWAERRRRSTILKEAQMDNTKIYGRKLSDEERIESRDLVYRRDGRYYCRANKGMDWTGHKAKSHPDNPVYRLTPNEEFFRTYERGSDE